MPDKRSFEWFTTDTGFQSLASAAQTNLTLYSATLVGARFIKGATVTRMLLDLRLRSDSVAQLVEAYFGILPVNADARAAGAFPDVDDASDRAGWLYRAKFRTIQDSLSDSSQWDTRHLDLRAQRILRTEEDELQLVVDASGSGFTLQWAAYIRVLMRMP